MVARWPGDSQRSSQVTPEVVCGRVMETVRGVEPVAEVVLFGSRARGDAQDDSDWDFLVLLEGAVDREREDAICHPLYRLELDLEQILNPVVLSREEWESPLYRAMPFHQFVDQDGVVL